MKISEKLDVILYAPSFNTGGGTERVLVNLANELIRKNYKVIIVANFIGNTTVYSLNDLVVVKQFWFAKIRSKYSKSILIKLISKLLGATFLNLFLKKIIRDNKSVIISFSNSITIDCFKTSFKRKLVAFEHWPYWISDKNPKLQKNIKRIYPQLKKVIVLTKHEKIVYNGIGCNNVEIIPNAYSFLPETTAKLDNKIVLSIGHFNEQKRRDLLVKTWKGVNEKHPDWKLIIVGDGHQREEVLEQIKELNINSSVEIVNPTREIIDYYLKSSIYVMSSEYEALPMVLIEAKICGLPCVSFDIISGPIEIIQNNKDGFIVPFHDTDELADKVNHLIENETTRKKFGLEARQDALRRFSPELIYDIWDQLLLKL